MREQRKHPRLPLPYSVELLYRGRSYRGILENLSVNGALVRLHDQVDLPTGQGCLLRIEVSSEGESAAPLQLGAETIHSSLSLIGIRFTGCQDEVQGELLLLAQRMAAEPDRLGRDLERIRGYLSDFRNALR